MAKSASIQKVSPRHEQILNYLLSYPTAKYSQVAAEFKVTPAWLSTIIHSHAFQHLLKKRQDEFFDVAVVQGLGSKMSAAAHMTLDEYMEKVPNLSADQLISSSDKLLSKLGYGSKNGGGGGTTIIGNVTQNVQTNHVAKDVLDEARNRIGSHKVGETDSQAAIPDLSANEGTEIEGALVRESRS